MQIDLVILAAVGLVSITGGCYLLREAKKYGKTGRGESESASDERAKQSAGTDEECINNITPVEGSIFLDLGFPPDGAERLKAETDQQEKSEH